MEESDLSTVGQYSDEDHPDFIGPRRPTQAELEAAIDEIVSEDLGLGALKAVVTPQAEIGNDLTKKAFDSYMVLEEDLELGQHRLLETDNQLYLPSWTQIRFLITSDDVIHA